MAGKKPITFETKCIINKYKELVYIKMKKKIKIKSRLSNLAIVENAIDDIARDADISKENYGKILVSVMEAVNNAIIHGNKSDSRKSVDIELLLDKESLVVKVEDEGKGFNHHVVPDPTKPENLQKTSGRGVYLMKKLADEIEFNSSGNCVKMTFKL